jgi:hypothetical protein
VCRPLRAHPLQEPEGRGRQPLKGGLPAAAAAGAAVIEAAAPAEPTGAVSGAAAGAGARGHRRGRGRRWDSSRQTRIQPWSYCSIRQPHRAVSLPLQSTSTSRGQCSASERVRRGVGAQCGQGAQEAALLPLRHVAAAHPWLHPLTRTLAAPASSCPRCCCRRPQRRGQAVGGRPGLPHSRTTCGLRLSGPPSAAQTTAGSRARQGRARGQPGGTAGRRGQQQ